MGNPLLSYDFPPPFAKVDETHIQGAVEALIEDAEAALVSIETNAAPPTFANTLLPLDAATLRLGRVMGLLSHLEAVKTSPAFRDAFNEAQPIYQAFESKIPLRAALYRRVRAFGQTAEAKSLTGPRKRLLEQTLRFFRRAGAELEATEKARLEAIDVELGKITLKYSQNVVDATGAFELIVDDETRLAGLPDRAKRAAAQSAKEAGTKGFRFTLQAPSYIPALTYLEDGTLREQLYRAMSTRATAGDGDNRPLIRRILQLRREKAKLLGYDSFADLVLEERMAKRGADARAFVDGLTEKTRAAFARETRELTAFRRKLEGDDAPPLQPWDVSFYAEKLRQAEYQFDAEALRPYFAFERVLEGVFDLAHQLFGVRFEPWTDAPSWHESVRAYKLLDHDGRWLAGVWTDPYPREEKRGGAWMHGLLGRGCIEADHRHAAVLAANVSPPVDGEPALLSHRDTETIFHETGHLLHHCLSRAELSSHAGTNVAWDFVELPSQILENWCWEKEALDRFAHHVDSGETIEPTLLDKMLKARTFRAASMQMRQLGLATVDLALHTEFDPDGDEDVIAFARDRLAVFSPTPLPVDYAMIASFDHLFSDSVGYAAGYYSYKWAEVLDADAFTRFKEEGILSADTGRAFRETILERGDEEDPALLYRSFRGREPDQEALLGRLGLSGA
ncbi:MAG: M3 family metallopeptidase [Myxococcota bacterium]